MTEAGFDIKPGEHPIVPVMLYDAPLAQKMADALLEEGIYVIGFLLSRRAQGRGAHPPADLGRTRTRTPERAVDAFTRIGKKLGVIE